jgi:molecular chaperone Hsp33
MPERQHDRAGDPGGASGEGELRRFVLERHPVRAFWTRLDGPWRELRSLRQYAPPVERLLGEAVTASVLLAATLKFQGTLTLQLQGSGCVRLLVAQCTHDLRIRGLARVDEAVDPHASFRDLVGESRLVVTIEADEHAARYQGIVQLQGETLSACLESYFATSEQLPTRIALAADAAYASGVLLQQMPSAQGDPEGLASQDAWEEVQQNLKALPASLLQHASAEEVLRRLGGSHDGRLFAGTTVQFACRCSGARVARLLRSLGPQEIQSVLAEMGSVTVTCEFCGRPYRFDSIDIERLFHAAASPETPRSLN